MINLMWRNNIRTNQYCSVDKVSATVFGQQYGGGHEFRFRHRMPFRVFSIVTRRVSEGLVTRTSK